MADSASRAGQTYATPAILEHLARLHAPHDAALDTAFRASQLHGIPGIQVGPHEGALLGWLLRGMEASRVIEIGTLAGFSAIHLARALRPVGRLYTLEISENHAAIARDNLRAAGLEDRAEVMLGDALSSLAALAPRGPFDVIFVDADKGRYDQYARWAIEHLRPGGVLIADNVLFFGRLLDDHPEAAAMRRFHEVAAQHLDTALVPTPDGLLVGRARAR
jgi:caffeoyl-CoA O-methyltransferase